MWIESKIDANRIETNNILPFYRRSPLLAEDTDLKFLGKSVDDINEILPVAEVLGGFEELEAGWLQPLDFDRHGASIGQPSAKAQS